MKVECDTELIEVDGRRLVFKVEASDEKGLIGKGTHERFIIESQKFREKTLLFLFYLIMLLFSQL